MLVLQISVWYVVLHYLYMLSFFGLQSLTAHQSEAKNYEKMYAVIHILVSSILYTYLYF